MKKLATLLLAAGLVFGAATGASAIDFKAKGQWIMSFDYGQNGNFQGKYNSKTPTGWGKGNEDEFEARQRIRLQLDAVASESLSGTVYFEIGDTIWGQSSTGGALGADQKIVELKHAYIDWMVPETTVKVRMGIQAIATPAYASGMSVLNDDMAGIVVNGQINDNVGVTVLWARPYNDNYNAPDAYQKNYMDNFDVVGLLVPLTFDGVKVTPFGMYAGIGPNTFRDGDNYFSNFPSPGGGYARSGLLPVGGPRNKAFQPDNKKISQYANAWWAGLSADMTLWDPLRVAFDFAYGQVDWEDNDAANREGWFASLLLEYNLDWAIPGLYGWYSSGDDDDPSNGSERLPSIDSNNTNNYSNFAFDGDPYIARDAVVGHEMAGTWGIGARLKDMSFIEDLKHTFRVNYIGGTNSPTMAKKMSLAGYWANGNNLVDEGNPIKNGIGGLYLTTEDSALEFGLTNTYKMYENFTITLEADYIALWLDTSKSVWGARNRVGGHIPDTKDAWNINASFVYQF